MRACPFGSEHRQRPRTGSGSGSGIDRPRARSVRAAAQEGADTVRRELTCCVRTAVAGRLENIAQHSFRATGRVSRPLFSTKRDSLDRAGAPLRAASWRSKRGPSRVMNDLTEVLVAPDTYHVSPEPLLMVAELHGALALCLHDEGRGVGGMLHLRFVGGTGRPSDVTDNTLSSVLVVLDKFKRAVLGNSTRRDEIQARILAHALPPAAGEPSASLVDLIQADLADTKIACGSQTTRRTEPLRVCFQPFEGRVWVCGPDALRAAGRKARRSAG